MIRDKMIDIFNIHNTFWKGKFTIYIKWTYFDLYDSQIWHLQIQSFFINEISSQNYFDKNILFNNKCNKTPFLISNDKLTYSHIN